MKRAFTVIIELTPEDNKVLGSASDFQSFIEEGLVDVLDTEDDFTVEVKEQKTS